MIVFMLACLIFLLIKVKEPKLKHADARRIQAIRREVETAEAKTSHAMRPEVERSFILILASIFLWFMGYNAITTSFSKYAKRLLGS
jgi:Ca2+/Na+ antiporter